MSIETRNTRNQRRVSQQPPNQANTNPNQHFNEPNNQVNPNNHTNNVRNPRTVAFHNPREVEVEVMKRVDWKPGEHQTNVVRNQKGKPLRQANNSHGGGYVAHGFTKTNEKQKRGKKKESKSKKKKKKKSKFSRLIRILEKAAKEEEEEEEGEDSTSEESVSTSEESEDNREFNSSTPVGESKSLEVKKEESCGLGSSDSSQVEEENHKSILNNDNNNNKKREENVVVVDLKTETDVNIPSTSKPTPKKKEEENDLGKPSAKKPSSKTFRFVSALRNEVKKSFENEKCQEFYGYLVFIIAILLFVSSLKMDFWKNVEQLFLVVVCHLLISLRDMMIQNWEKKEIKIPSKLE